MLLSNNSLYSGDDILVVIDPSTTDYDRIAAKVSPKASVIVLGSQMDAIAQISAAIHYFKRSFSSIHLIVDASPGTLHFTSGNFSFKTLKGSVDELQSWFANSEFSSERPDPQLFIYSRRFTAGKVGRQFADTLAWLTGATIATANTQVAGQRLTISNITSEVDAGRSVVESAV